MRGSGALLALAAARAAMATDACTPGRDMRLRWQFGRRARAAETLREVRRRFTHFTALLDGNNRVLRIIGDMEEKSGGDYLFDTAYLRQSVTEISRELAALIEHLVALDGEQHAPLRQRQRAIDADIERLLAGAAPPAEGRLTIPLDELGRGDADEVGGKSANLGEIRGRVGLPVPDGFAITAWAYRVFLEENGLRERIDACLRSLDLRSHTALVEATSEIRAAVLAARVPPALDREIREAAAEVARRTGATRFALRSSAVGEDSALSFAGQYASCLGVPAPELGDCYREVVASKLTPQAIYYLRGHALSDSDPPMAVGCIALVRARAAGVAYSRNPVGGDDDGAVVHAVRGLGRLLVEGAVTPSVYRVDGAGTVRERSLAPQPLLLRPSEAGPPELVALGDEEQRLPPISDAEATRLAAYARRLEEHFGGPQDVEWAIDTAGKCFILQSRPLRVVACEPRSEVDTSSFEVLLAGGATASPGGGGGAVYQLRSPADAAAVPAGAVLVAPNPVPTLVAAMARAAAVVTCAGGAASHMATLAREYGVPALVGLEGADRLATGSVVTVDASARRVYAGLHPELVTARRGERTAGDDPALGLLARVLARVAPLGLLHPADADFTPERCATYHDLTRYAHQKAMEGMFATVRSVDDLGAIGVRVASKLPLEMRGISLERNLASDGGRDVLPLEAFDSPPLAAFWSGIEHEGWPSQRVAADFRGLAGLIAATAAGVETADFREDCFAIIGRDYLLCSIRMGFHFSTVEAMASSDTARNYVRVQFKGGGTLADRRRRRVDLLARVLGLAGFEAQVRGDFLDARSSYDGQQAVCDKLRLVGRLTIMTKQLDMALSSDGVTEWYLGDFVARLGLRSPGAA